MSTCFAGSNLKNLSSMYFQNLYQEALRYLCSSQPVNSLGRVDQLQSPPPTFNKGVISVSSRGRRFPESVPSSGGSGWAGASDPVLRHLVGQRRHPAVAARVPALEPAGAVRQIQVQRESQVLRFAGFWFISHTKSCVIWRVDQVGIERKVLQKD